VRKLIVSEFVSLDGIMQAPQLGPARVAQHSKWRKSSRPDLRCGEPGHPHSGWVGDVIGPDEINYKLDQVLEAESLRTWW
jgi:hypothetical protein